MPSLILLLSLIGCDSAKSPLDTAGVDTAVSAPGDDTGASEVDDTSGAGDSGGAGETGAGETGAGDTGAGDTGAGDTGAGADSAGGETGGAGPDTADTGDKEDAPVVTWLDPLGGEYLYGDRSLQVDATDDVLVVWVEFYIDGVLLDYDIDGAPWQVTWPSDDSVEGAHTLTAVAYDDVSESGEASVDVIVDRSPPEVIITDPADGDDVSGTVTVTASVVEDNLDAVEFWVEGALAATFAPGDALAYDWDVRGLPSGSYPIEVIATDRAGLSGSDSVAVSVSNTPEVILVEPADGETVSGQVALTATATDDGTVASLDFLLDGAVHDSLTGASPYSSSWDTCGVAPGAVVVEAQALDDEGLSGSDSATVTVDQPFEIDLLGPSGAVEPSALLTTTLYDDRSVTGVVWDLDGAVIASAAAASALPADVLCAFTCGCDYYEEGADLTGFSAGSYTLTVTATNTAGETASDATTVTIDSDADGDGYTDVDWGGDDCDDDDAAINPGATELCDGVDNDCDGAVDEPDAADADTWYADTDGDSFGDAGAALSACDQPDGYTADDQDCDDGDAAVNPDATEICNAIDDDCDGLVDDDDPDLDTSTAQTWYVDADGDGFGDPGLPAVVSCLAPPGYDGDGGDCDDGDPEINPAAVDLCDAVDNDCDASTVEDGVVTMDGDNYPSIQDALSAASDGALVTICDGTYTEALTVSADVTLESLNGAGAVTVDAGGAGSVIDIDAGSDVVIRGLTLSGGIGTYDAGVGGRIGGGVNAYYADSVSIYDSIIDGNTATLGGGVLGSGYGGDVIEDTTIRGNTADTGGGLFAFGVDFAGVQIDGNEADYGGGAYFYADVVTMDSDTVVVDNVALIGGGLWVDEADLILATAATVSGNLAQVSGGGTGGGGGIYLQGGTLTGGILSGNRAEDYGGGLFVESGVAVDSVIIEDNVADYGGGGAVFITSDITVTDLEISGNDALIGGGVWLEDTDTEIRDSTLNDNTASYGGGLVIYRSTNALLRSSVINDNTASVEGGGVFLVGLWTGGGALLEDASFTSTSSDWGTGALDNSAEDVWVDYWDDPYSYGTAATFTCTMSLGGCF